MRHPGRSRKPRLLLGTVMAWANAAVAGGTREAANAVADPTRTSVGSFMAHSSSSRDQSGTDGTEGCGKAYTTWIDLLSPQLALLRHRRPVPVCRLSEASQTRQP